MSKKSHKSINCYDVMECVKSHVKTYLAKDTIPIVVAIIDPKISKIGISIQKDYPLTEIERKYGVPFGRFRNNAVKLLADTDVLHGFKWSIETHEAVFAADARFEERDEDDKTRRIRTVVSTGLGNLLQNKRSLAYFQHSVHYVVGDQPYQPPPLACFVLYNHIDKGVQATSKRVGVELMLFSAQGGCHFLDKDKYFTDHVKAMELARQITEDHIVWAVSGYPLRLADNTVRLEMIAQSVSDYRHLWRLPKLDISMAAYLKEKCRVEETRKKIEFFFGFEEIQHPEHFLKATDPNRQNDFPLDLALKQEWIDTVCLVCQIAKADFEKIVIFDAATSSIKLKIEEVQKDFENTGYICKNCRDDVKNTGDFFIDTHNRRLIVKLLPAIYPHHIVGISQNGEVVNISICGQSGKSGVTIEDAQKICEELELPDALIFDNGNDVFARLYSSETVCHDENKRQTRLTAALHFAYLLEPGEKAGVDFLTGYRQYNVSSVAGVAPSSGTSVSPSYPSSPIGPSCPSATCGAGRPTNLNHPASSAISPNSPSGQTPSVGSPGPDLN